MCLTIPGKVISIDGSLATIDYGSEGIRQNINISMVRARIGAYVLVQGGVAIQLLDDREAEEALQTWKMIEEELED
ncbi:MAG TPA: HypC/HybG/HupF family hydrogenase formation chaperone [Candidatus Bathyarchaeia archaeon]|nr:HypC/HybG/HupF family hydrogenase formation chaperone [Candidatus Bathyarchaeia archaeon]